MRRAAKVVDWLGYFVMIALGSMLATLATYDRLAG